jgi:hypothetical protein
MSFGAKEGCFHATNVQQSSEVSIMVFFCIVAAVFSEVAELGLSETP